MARKENTYKNYSFKVKKSKHPDETARAILNAVAIRNNLRSKTTPIEVNEIKLENMFLQGRHSEAFPETGVNWLQVFDNEDGRTFQVLVQVRRDW